jgi:two-component system chemotaxis sensor kinase CheA
MVRDLAHSDGKEVEFRMEGDEVNADRLVLQQLKDPVMHILRNAIAHGIEMPRERLAAGKSRTGSILLRLEARGGRLGVTIADDGRGIDYRTIAEVAVRRGLLSQANASTQSRPDLLKLIFEPGFSTAKAITSLEGRGMGLSVVQERLARLQGEVTVNESGGPGTTIVLTVPLSISTHHMVLVACGAHTFGIPASAVRRLCRVKIDEIESVEGHESIRFESRPIPLAKLSDLLDLPEAVIPPGRPLHENGNGRAIPLVVLQSGGHLLGITVDALLDEREAVVKDLNLPAASAGMATGAIPLEDGTVAVVLSPLALADRFREAGKPAGYKSQDGAPQKMAPTILVVDDSITTRSLEKSILEAHGYRVQVAVDGVEALAQLRVQPSDLVISDVMMPRMDGFQLLEEIKKDRQLAHIPVIIVTSIEQREEQERGLSLGADAYIVKRKFDQRELLDTVRQIL